MTNFIVNIAEGAYEDVKSALASVGHALEPAEAQVKAVVTAEIPALTAWGAQFLTDEGKVILSDAITYGPQILAGTVTIIDAADKLWVDLKAKGITDIEALGETVFNALRTQTNAAASVVTTPESPPATPPAPVTGTTPVVS